jgi:uncharacterized membrane protein YhaH (DUF805 family)
MIQLPNRLGRLSFMAGYLLLMIGIFIFALILLMISPSIQNFSSDGYDNLRLGIPALLYMIGGTILQTRRLHDLNRSSWWAIGLNILFCIGFKLPSYKIFGVDIFYTGLGWVYLISFCALCLMPGTAAPNRYGALRPAATWEKVCGWIAVFPLALISLLILTSKLEHHASKPTLPVVNKYHAPYPFTADQLWDNILKITALPNGKFNKTDVEQALGVTLHPVDANLLSSEPYEAQAHSDWYFDIKVYKTTLGILYFQLGLIDTDTKAGNDLCINIDRIKPSLIAQGWILSETQSNTIVLPLEVYHKSAEGGNPQLKMLYALQTRCIKRIDLFAAQ